MSLWAAYRNVKLALLIVLPLTVAIPVGRVLEIVQDGKRQAINGLSHHKTKMKLAHPATLAPQTSIPRDETRTQVVKLDADALPPKVSFEYLFSCRAVTRDVPTPPPRVS